MGKLTSSTRPIGDLTTGAVNSHPAEKTFKILDTPFRLQSAQVLFSGLLTSSRRVRACFSLVALSWRVMEV